MKTAQYKILNYYYYLAINNSTFVGYEELSRSRRVLAEVNNTLRDFMRETTILRVHYTFCHSSSLTLHNSPVMHDFRICGLSKRTTTNRRLSEDIKKISY